MSEISQEAARAMLAALKKAFDPNGIVSAWPDCGWPDDEEDDGSLADEDWIVGIGYRRPFDDSSAYKVEPLSEPASYQEFATVRGQHRAQALADLLNIAAAQPPRAEGGGS